MFANTGHKMSFLSVILEEAEDPACMPIFWISKWVDYSDKYGLGKNQGTFTVQLTALNKCFALGCSSFVPITGFSRRTF